MQNFCCENCLFGILAPNRYKPKTTKQENDAPQIAYHCTINPPIYPSGHPIVDALAVCALFTTKAKDHKQPLRSLTFPNGVPGFTLTMKG